MPLAVDKLHFLLGIIAPQQEYDRRLLGIDGLNDGIGEYFPALILVRGGLVCLHRQHRVGVGCAPPRWTEGSSRRRREGSAEHDRFIDAGAGVQAGDIILSYADERMFSWSDLRDATSDGERGEVVFLRLQRGGETLDISIPRGPLGVRLDAASVGKNRR